ncbi:MULTISPECIES: ABC-2 transporter permease [Oceanobacillus]|uniref:ABC transporter permease n=1 Tax=Oceanobacillus kimchii TaxID=746691 RepID=A0ABQ5THZ7_9BACI|nr:MULTISPECIES: ABC-2 transporter permease [Oceanobacillus]MBT2601374.1 ABC-2 transporter permease [Oceanobacillus sp. ISL-74]MBT2653460.1 ABC-2 transporter permease [Oceanobacillus sp. ISL-73]OEH53241.1 ABC transporter permease [Oceanobacillus sp. E9]GLO65351.1 ABC transporter permease [Oceanobacillus kimchii]
MQWNTLFQKEVVENWRNKKWIWFPLVIILLSILDPVTNYFLPQILEAVGEMPEGMEFILPEYTVAEVVMMTLGQLSSLGVLVIVFSSMGIIANEHKSGVSQIILVKPIDHHSYVTAKWASLLLLVWVSWILGMLVSWYYIYLLYGPLSFNHMVQTIFFYGLWLSLVVTVVVFYNTFVKSQGLIAFLSIASLMILSALTQVFQSALKWSPIHLSDYIKLTIDQSPIHTDLIYTGIVTIIIIAILLLLSVILFRKQQLER